MINILGHNFGKHASLGSEISTFDEIAIRTVLDSFSRKDLSILEVGSWVGMGSTKVFADYAETLICVDTWEGEHWLRAS